MSPRQRKPWAKVIDEAGITVRLYEREPGKPIHREVWIDGRRDRKSLGHTDRRLAEDQARTLARRLSELRFIGQRGAVTLGEAWGQYQLHRLPLLSPNRQAHARQHAAFFLAHLGHDFRLEDLSQTHVDSFAAARRAGILRSRKHRQRSGAVRDGTIRQNLNWLAALVRWARGYRLQGRPLLATDPLVGLTFPREKNVRRPIASPERYRRTLAQAAAVDPTGRFACILALVRYTGRRINAVVQLTAADLHLTRDAVLRALAAAGLDEALADYMPHGAIRWPARTDKQQFEELTALSKDARAAVDAYLAAHPVIGHAPLFPKAKDPTAPIRKATAAYWLERAERRAKLPKLERGGFHAYRRLWASERRHLPDVDVAKAGGWRDLATMKRSYQQPDPATVLQAIENPPTPPVEPRSAPEPEADRHTSVTRSTQAADAQ